MSYFNNVLEAIGNTPLIRLNSVSKGLVPTILAKIEYLNPGGSNKDRIALGLIQEAEASGKLKKGGTIVEPTSGNTGVGLAMVAALRGYHCVCVMPDKVSKEKQDLLKAYGAEVVMCPTDVTPDDPRMYVNVAKKISEERDGAYWPNQYHNAGNPTSHYRSTGPEIWKQTEGKITTFVCGMGTGGTISGVGKYLKEQNPAIRVVGIDPEGSIYTGDTPRTYLVEGIGEDFMPSTFNASVIDEMIRISDKESFAITRRMAREEGLLVGGSSGTAVAGALKYAQKAKPDELIVVLLPDSGRGYISKIFSDEWMKKNGMID